MLLQHAPLFPGAEQYLQLFNFLRYDIIRKSLSPSQNHWQVMRSIRNLPDKLSTLVIHRLSSKHSHTAKRGLQ